MRFFGKSRKDAIKTHVRNTLYLAAGIFRLMLTAPRSVARHFLGRYSQKKVSAELKRFINLYMASALLSRLLILSFIATFYVIVKELHLNTDLYVAIITVLMGLYTGIIVIIGSFLYLDFCLQRRIRLNPWQVAYHYTAQEIKRAIDGNSRTARLLLRIAVGNTEEFAHEVAYSAIYSEEIKKIIFIRVFYYVFILAAYLLGYNIVYFKLIAIDFHNFIHPFTWAWFYLVNAAS